LAEQAVGVFADASLSGAVGVGEVEVASGLLGEGAMRGHLASLIVGEGSAHLAFEGLEDVGEGIGSDLGASVVKLDEGDEQSGSLDQDADAGAVHGSLDRVALPVAGDDALGDLARVDADRSGSWRARKGRW
jgi:hypothetical protein